MSEREYRDFTQDDLAQINQLMRAFPHVAHGFRAVISVSRGLSFPVESAEGLREAIAKYGDGDGGDTAIPVDDLPALMPPYYFPITDEDDFLQKVSDAVSRLREPAGPNMPTVVLREAVAAQRSSPPRTSVEETIRNAGLSSEHRTPSVGGVSERTQGA